MRRRATLVGLALTGVSVVGALGYAFIGSTWNTDRIVMHLQLGDSGGTLIDGADTWNTVAETALAHWNGYIRRAQFYVVRDSTVPIAENDDVNSVFFDNTVFGFSFDGAVAVTTEWRRQGARVEADVVFNTAYDWNSYRGQLRRSSSGGTLYDLQRVAIHEFGHVLGLDHPDEDGQLVRAIMNSYVSNIDDVTDDDIAGARALYGARVTRTLAEFTRPSKRNLKTRVARKTFRGTARESRVTAVYLRSNRIHGTVFKARGVERWRRAMRLRRGINRIILYVETGNGQLREVDRVRVTRR